MGTGNYDFKLKGFIGTQAHILRYTYLYTKNFSFPRINEFLKIKLTWSTIMQIIHGAGDCALVTDITDIEYNVQAAIL